MLAICPTPSDLLIAYEDQQTCHMIFLEVKGTLAFSNPQLRSKASPLTAIFGAQGNTWTGITPHFAILSPKHPLRLQDGSWPTWMKPSGQVTWIEMKLPKGLQKIVRCDEYGKKGIRGEYWKVVPDEF